MAPFRNPFRRKRQPHHLRQGEWGERQAERILRRKGYRLIGRRVRVGRRDEIDLIARDGDVLVFVEVKTRADERFGSPAAAVDRRKRRLLSRAAIRYINHLKRPPDFVRFDIVEVIGCEGAARPVIRHIPGAFTLEGHYRVRW